MSSAPSEPEKYSIDEMMDRLKGPSSESPSEGELVTRQDGTQAIRVRKRKRRSSQPHKEEVKRNRKARILQVSAALVLVFLAALAVGAGVIYANSSPFRSSLESKITSSSGAKIEMSEFRMNPQTANAGRLVFAWPEGNVLGKLDLRDLKAEIFPSSFLGKAMTGEEITIRDGLLELRLPKSGEAVRENSPLTGALPVRFNRYRAPRFGVVVGDPTAPALKLVETEASFDPQNINGRAQLNLYQGNLIVPGWPKFRVDRAAVEFRGDEAEIVGLRVLHEKEDRGSLEISGTVSPYKPEQASLLNVRMDSFPISGVLGNELGEIISGRIDSRSNAKSNYLTFHPRENSEPVLDLDFQTAPSSGISMKGLQFFVILSQLLNDRWYENPVFSGAAKGTVHRERGVTTLRNVDFENRTRMILKGSISINQTQMLSGTLQVGVTEAMIAAAGPDILSLFGPAKDGFRWIDIDVSGQATAPKDNFAELVQSVRSQGRGKASPGKDSTPSTFDSLTRPK